MIGLKSNKITIDIHESKVPLSMQPDRVEIFIMGIFYIMEKSVSTTKQEW